MNDSCFHFAELPQSGLCVVLLILVHYPIANISCLNIYIIVGFFKFYFIVCIPFLVFIRLSIFSPNLSAVFFYCPVLYL